MPLKNLRPVFFAGGILFLAGLVPSEDEGVAFSQSNLYTFPGPDVDLGVHYTTFTSSGQHYIGAKGDTVYVVTSNGWVWCQKSTDGGQTFGSPVVVGAGREPSMRVDTAGIIYVAFEQNADIYFSKSTDAGMSFTPGVKVNDDTSAQVEQERPSIAVNNKGQIFIVWTDWRTNPPAIFSTASYDGGLSFTQNIQVNEASTGAGGGGDIATGDDGKVFIAYVGMTSGQRGIVVARSNDTGSSYSYYALVSTTGGA